MSNLLQYRKKANRLLENHRQVKLSVEQEESALEKTTQKIKDTTEANQTIQSIAQAIQEKIHTRIAAIVTRCLNAVFDDPYEFQIKFERKRGKTEAKMVFIRDGMELDDPMQEIGGGVIDIASFALRLASIILSNPKLDRVLVLDEPWKAVRGEGNKKRTRAMLLKLADDLKFQFIVNTDIEAYKSLGKVIELS